MGAAAGRWRVCRLLPERQVQRHARAIHRTPGPIWRRRHVRGARRLDQVHLRARVTRADLAARRARLGLHGAPEPQTMKEKEKEKIRKR